MSIVYDVYSGDHAGGPIDYSTPVASGLTALTYATAALPLNSQTWFGVRKRETVSGLDDGNTDARVFVLIDGSGNDVTNRPPAPQHVRAFAAGLTTAVVEWAFPYLQGNMPTGFHVYDGAGGAPSYASPVATVPFTGASVNRFAFRTSVTGLTAGTTYQFGVRAYNATGEEPNTNTVSLTMPSAPPNNATSLAAAASF